MFVTDLEGNDYPIQATTTNEAELNGNQSISLIIEANKVNNLFIDNLERMWQITDHDDITYIIIYCIRKGKGDKLTINVKGIPLFFDKLDTMRTYEEYNQSMTASVFFNLVFKDTGFFPVLVDPFYSVEWEGLGKGETQLSMFKKGLNRYKAEFEIKGNDIHLRTKVGRDTSFMYRYKLNASNIVEENDASALYTYAKGFGNFAEDDEANAKLIREYTSPLSSLIGIRHAPPIYDGRMTIASELDNRIKRAGRGIIKSKRFS